MARCTFCLLFFLFVLQLSSSKTKKETSGEEESEKWKKKDIRDYNEADIERLFEQWEVRIFISSRFGALSDLVNIILSHTVNYSTIYSVTLLLPYWVYLQHSEDSDTFSVIQFMLSRPHGELRVIK